jgi:hypothetical protein
MVGAGRAELAAERRLATGMISLRNTGLIPRKFFYLFI